MVPRAVSLNRAWNPSLLGKIVHKHKVDFVIVSVGGDLPVRSQSGNVAVHTEYVQNWQKISAPGRIL